MKNRNLQNENLDRIGRELLEAARISNDEIEKIAAAPHLFDSVKARIKTEQRAQTEKFSADRWNLFVWNWQKTFAAFAVSAIFVFGIFGFIAAYKISNLENQIAEVPEIFIENDLAEISQISEIKKDLPKTENKGSSIVKPFFRQAVSKNENLRAKKQPRKNNSAEKSNAVENAPVKEFYALNYIADPNETGENLRIVRAEMSRSQLFAMGVNIPIENEPEKVKTDLLVGTDGVARAIRIVE